MNVWVRGVGTVEHGTPNTSLVINGVNGLNNQVVGVRTYCKTANFDLEYSDYVFESSASGQRVVVSEYEVVDVVDMSLFPNPSIDFVNLYSKRLISHVMICNEMGSSVELVENQEGGENLVLDMTSKEKGVYILKVQYLDGTFEAKKVVIF